MLINVCTNININLNTHKVTKVEQNCCFFTFSAVNGSFLKEGSILKVTCRVQIWKKTFCQNSDKFCCSFIKNDIMFMYLLYIYKKPIILSLFKIDTLNFTMYILANLRCPLKTSVRLHNLISMNIFFTIKDHSFSL